MFRIFVLQNCRAHALCRGVLCALRSQRVLMGIALCLCFMGVVQAQTAPVCELNRPVRFAGMNWESNLVLTEVERFIMRHGYGCTSEVLPTESMVALAALQTGDLDVIPEMWTNSVQEAWSRALATGKVRGVGHLFTGREAWYIMRHTAERLPDLKRVTDLPRFKDWFKDPEDPGKGRIYGCPAGWFCEIVNINLWKAFALQDSYNMFSPGSGATQQALVTAAYQRKEDIVFYWWEPTPLAGSQDLVELEFPPYDAQAFQCLINPDCADPKPSAFFDNPVFTAISTEFAQQAPALTQFLARVTIPAAVVSATLRHMEDTQSEPDATARWFLQNQQAVWVSWVSADVAARVKAAL